MTIREMHIIFELPTFLRMAKKKRESGMTWRDFVYTCIMAYDLNKTGGE